MGARFSEEEKEALRTAMINRGFQALKEGGIAAVNIDEITAGCYVAKGTFYNLFESKTEFLYRMMIFKRQESKNRVFDYLDAYGKLSWNGLYDYLRWLADENPNIFSYLDDEHTRWLISRWPPEYLENEENDEQTARRIISFLAHPKENTDWQLFCNYLKITALTLNNTEYLIADAAEVLINRLIRDACDCICER